MGPTNAYTAIEYDAVTTSDVFRVKPLYYGMWAVASAIANGAVMVVANVSTSSPLLKAYALRTSTTPHDSSNLSLSWRVVLLHKDVNATGVARACVQLPAAQVGHSAVVWRLQAPSPWATTGITWAGQSFDGSTDGWPVGPVKNESVTRDPHTQCFNFDVSPGSVVLFEYR